MNSFLRFVLGMFLGLPIVFSVAGYLHETEAPILISMVCGYLSITFSVGLRNFLMPVKSHSTWREKLKKYS